MPNLEPRWRRTRNPTTSISPSPHPQGASRENPMGLCAAQCRGTMSVLLPSAYHLSPAIGLIAMHSQTFAANIRQSTVEHGCGWGLGPSSALARDIFSQTAPGEALRPTRNRSQAAAHLCPSMIGTILGLGITQACPEQVQTSLKAAGIRCTLQSSLQPYPPS